MKKIILTIILGLFIISPKFVSALDLELTNEQAFGGSGFDLFGSIVETHDSNGKVDGYVAVGSIDYYDDAVIVKYDLNLNIIWQKIEGTDNTNNDSYNSVVESYDSSGKIDGYIVVGYI